MLSRRIVGSARFLQLPLSSQALYFHLVVHADDDGVVEAFTVLRNCGASKDDLKVLSDKKFVVVLNDDLVTYIVDWLENNRLRSDRKVNSIYQTLVREKVPGVKFVVPKPRADTGKKTGADNEDNVGRPTDDQWTSNGQPVDSPTDDQRTTNGRPVDVQENGVTPYEANDSNDLEAGRPLDNQWTSNGQPMDGIGQYSLVKNRLEEDRLDESSSSGSSMTDQNEIDEVSDRGGAKNISGSDSLGQREQVNRPTATSAPVANQVQPGEAQASAMAPVAASAGQAEQSATDYSQQAQQLGLKLTPKIRQGLNQLAPDAAAYVLQYAHDNATSNATGYLQTLLNSFEAKGATSLAQVQAVIQSYHSQRRKGKIHEQLPAWAQKDYQAASVSKISPAQAAKTNAHIAELMSDYKTDKQGV